MRASTKSAVGVITLGVLGLSWHFGQDAVVASGGFAAPSTNASSSPSQTSTSEPVPTASASVAAGSAGSESVNNGGVAPAPQPSASASTAPTPQPSASATKNTTSGASVTKAGSVVESGFGTVQVEVTKTGSTITNITMLQANATHGRAGAFPYLIQYAISANGSNFANLTGATYTTTAFKRSLEAALAKF